MTATYNPAEVERLIAEAREDDRKLERAPWTATKHGSMGSRDFVMTRGDGSYEIVDQDEAEALSRARNNLRSLADQLEAARAEVERLTAALPNWSHAEALQQRDALIAANVAAQAEIRRLTAAAQLSRSGAAEAGLCPKTPSEIGLLRQRSPF